MKSLAKAQENIARRGWVIVALAFGLMLVAVVLDILDVGPAETTIGFISGMGVGVMGGGSLVLMSVEKEIAGLEQEG